jgi:hypothetical protein
MEAAGGLVWYAGRAKEGMKRRQGGDEQKKNQGKRRFDGLWL